MNINIFTRKGIYHKDIQKENQDYVYAIDEKDFLAIMLADGATACEMGLEGAKLSCHAMMEIIKHERDVFFNYTKQKMAYLLSQHILYCIECNKSVEHNISEYGSTFAMVFMEKRTGKAVSINLGDSAVIIVTEKSWFYLLEPKRYQGNPCLTTTEGAEKSMGITVFNLSLGDSIFIGSDGFLEQLRNEETLSCLCLYDIAGLNKILSLAENEDDCSYISFTRERK